MLPTTLERIGENAFEGDKELQAVEFSGTYPKDWNALMKRTAGGNEPLKNLTREQITAYSNLDSIATNDAYGVAKYATTDAQTAFRAFTTLQTEMKKYTNCAKNVASEAQNKILNESEDEENERRIKAIRSGELKSALDTYESVYLSGLRKETRTAIMNAICLGFADKVDDLVEHKFKLGKIDLDAGKINGTKLDMTTDVITVQIIYKVGHYLDDLLKQREVFKTTATVKDGTYNIHVFKSGALGSSIQITSNDSLVPIGGGTPQPFSLDKISGEAMMKQYLEELCGVSKELLKEGIAAYAKYLDDLTGIGSNLKGQAEEDIKNTLDAFLRIFGLNDKTNIAVNASKIYKINEEINIIKKKGDSLKFSDLKNAADNMKQISGLSLEEIRDEATKKIIQSINKALENYWDSAIFEPEKSHAETVEEIQKALVEDIKNQNRTKSGEYDWVIDHIGLRCPVDFRVYNGENECIGYVENGEVWYTSPIFILTEGDCKDVYLPGGMDVRFEFTGTGQGEMTYVMEEVCNGETVGRRNYYGIPLTEGVSYTQNFQTGNNLQNLQANVLLATDGSTIGGSEYLDAWDETQNSAIYIDCVAENGGVVIGAGNFVKGDTVTLDAIPDEGQEFVGWYVDERLVSAEKTYQFAALDCMEIHAKFRIPYEENDKYNVSMGSKYRYNTVVSVYQDSSALSHIELYQMSGQAGTLYRTIKAMLYDTNQTLYSERILTVEYDLKNSYWLQALDLKDCSKLELYDEYGNVIAVLRSDDENKDATYTITFDANGGTVTPVTATISTDGKLSALPIPTRTGYTFDGWYTAPKGGTKVDVNNVYTEDTTLYAHWMYMGSGSSGGNSGSSSGNSSNRPSGGSSFSGITITGPNHGFVTASPKNAGKGAKVTLTVWPDSGYILDSLTVKDSRGAEVELVKLSDTRYTFIMPGGQVTVNATFVRDSSESNTSTPVSGFYDVPDNHWASKEIAWASANGIMNGTGGGAFSPDSPVNRQQTWMVLGRSAGADPSNMAAAREWAIFNNISDGSNPINPVSRQQLVALLYRYTQMKEIAATGMASLEEYPDNSDVASYAKKAMAWAVGNGIVKGTSDGHLAPFNTTSRAQFAVILYRFTQQITN